MCGIAGFLGTRGLPSDAEDRTRAHACRHPLSWSGRVRDLPRRRSRSGKRSPQRSSISQAASSRSPTRTSRCGSSSMVKFSITSSFVRNSKRSAIALQTHSDTEVVLHLFEETGDRMPFTAQWAICLRHLGYPRAESLPRPGSHGRTTVVLHLASMEHSISGRRSRRFFNGAPIDAEIDHASLCDVFTFWSPLPGRSIFRGISEIPAGPFSRGEPRDRLASERYWQIGWTEMTDCHGRESCLEEAAAEELERLLVDSIRVRLRADVPVGVYLSGGLDSSTIAADCSQSEVESGP